MKKIIAVLVALATILSLTACGSYEITIKKDDDSSAADTVKENVDDADEVDKKEDSKDRDEDSEEKNKEDKEETEKETEIVIEGVPDFTKDIKKNKKLVEAYLRSIIDFDDFEEKEEDDNSDEYGYYEMRYFREDFTDAGIDYQIEIDGNSISFPTDLETLEECGFDFKSSTYNSDSELNKNTYGDIDMENSDDKGFSARFLNNKSSSSALSDCIVTRTAFNLNSEDTVDFSFNGIDKNSDVEDIVAEFGTPNRLGYQIYDDGRVYLYIYYLNWGDDKSWEEDKLYISYELTEDRIDMITYEIPVNSFD